jgi:deoxyribodipyrimidine photo-lyase
MTSIYWFRRDRRLADNPALQSALTQSDCLLPLTLRPIDETTPWGFARVGPHRHAFELQSLAGLAKSLASLGSALFQPQTPGIEGLLAVAQDNGIKDVFCEDIPAPEQQQAVSALRQAGLRVHALEQSALLPHAALPFEPDQAPLVFTEFRRQAEKHGALPRQPLPAPSVLPALPASALNAEEFGAALRLQIGPDDKLVAASLPLTTPSAFPYQLADWHGDEISAQRHLHRYFSSDLPSHYKETRNQLIGTDYSTKFSPWLAVGAVTGAQIWQALNTYENVHGANDSTYWIWFELLWRDHFRLMMQRFGDKLFTPGGLTTEPSPITKPNQQGFDRWRSGRTGHRLIDAGMRELAATGYLSNRMRQIVASYLIHDLRGDWQAGAAWFEHCLIDFDVHSNQGNWAYIAGVGTDPRGGRRFNPDKQADDHDRHGQYRTLWDTP